MPRLRRCGPGSPRCRRIRPVVRTIPCVRWRAFPTRLAKISTPPCGCSSARSWRGRTKRTTTRRRRRSPRPVALQEGLPEARRGPAFGCRRLRRFAPGRGDGGRKAACSTHMEGAARPGGSPETIVIGDTLPPLLRADRVLLDKDGQVVGEVVSTWNWPFARSLIDLLSAGRRPRADGRPDVATNPFVSAWYHDATAYMFASGLYGDATPHLHHASLVLPNDPASLFDRACYAEILGLPIHQELVPDATVDQRAQGQPGAPPAWKTPAWEPALRIPSADKTNAEAERLFRRALAIDPSLVEARVRLARLLDSARPPRGGGSRARDRARAKPDRCAGVLRSLVRRPCGTGHGPE